VAITVAPSSPSLFSIVMVPLIFAFVTPCPKALEKPRQRRVAKNSVLTSFIV